MVCCWAYWLLGCSFCRLTDSMPCHLMALTCAFTAFTYTLFKISCTLRACIYVASIWLTKYEETNACLDFYNVCVYPLQLPQEVYYFLSVPYNAYKETKYLFMPVFVPSIQAMKSHFFLHIKEQKSIFVLLYAFDPSTFTLAFIITVSLPAIAV